MPDNSQQTAAAWNTAAQLATTAASGYAAASMNKRTQKFNVGRYDVQRRDALADWQMQNEYNSPAAQMARFEAAGLNKNLIYGKGDSGNATPVRPNQTAQWTPKTADLSGVGNALSSYFNVLKVQAETNNIQAQRELISAQVGNTKQSTSNMQTTQEKTAAETQGLLSENIIKRNASEVSTALKQTSVEMGLQNLKKLVADTNYTLNNDQRQDAMNAATIAEAMSRIITNQANNAKTDAERQRIMAEIPGIKASVEIQQMDVELRKAGINPHSNIGFKVIEYLMSNVAGSREPIKHF